MTNLIQDLTGQGFERHHTGGGCYAYVRQNADGTSEWITDQSGTGDPEPTDWLWARYSTDNITTEGDVLDCTDSESSPMDLVSLIGIGA